MNDGMDNIKIIDLLLVEDSAGDARLAMEALKESKIRNRVDLVTDGEQAMEFLLKRGKYTDAVTPDLILLDLNLPKKDGRQVLKEVKAHPELRKIPVVILTTSKADEDIISTYENYANCYITKPIDLDQFAKVVRSIEDFWLSIVKLPSNGKHEE